MLLGGFELALVAFVLYKLLGISEPHWSPRQHGDAYCVDYMQILGKGLGTPKVPNK